MAVTSETIAGAIFLVLGILLVMVPRHMLRVNAYVMTKGGAPEDHDVSRDNVLVTRILGLVFLVMAGTIIF